MAAGSPERTIVLFERCVIACALYEEFWVKVSPAAASCRDIGPPIPFLLRCFPHNFLPITTFSLQFTSYRDIFPPVPFLLQHFPHNFLPIVTCTPNFLPIAMFSPQFPSYRNVFPQFPSYRDIFPPIPFLS